MPIFIAVWPFPVLRHSDDMAKIVCEWGLAGVEAWKDTASVFVIVDVLSFSTAVSVAVERGAEVIPFFYGDGDAATVEAARRGAVVASPRRARGGQLSLSPSSLRCLEPGARVLLPSPNGSLLSLATGDVPTLCGCLRNATVVAKTANGIASDGVVAVIAAGERWSDRTLRPAIEDWLGAGAIVRALSGMANAEAELATVSYSAAQDQLPELLRRSTSGRELIEWGFEADVEIALEVDASDAAPIMRDGAYRLYDAFA